MNEVTKNQKDYMEYVMLCENYNHMPIPKNFPWKNHYERLLQYHYEFENRSEEH